MVAASATTYSSAGIRLREIDRLLPDWRLRRRPGSPRPCGFHQLARIVHVSHVGDRNRLRHPWSTPGQVGGSDFSPGRSWAHSVTATGPLRGRPRAVLVAAVRQRGVQTGVRFAGGPVLGGERAVLLVCGPVARPTRSARPELSVRAVGGLQQGCAFDSPGLVGSWMRRACALGATSVVASSQLRRRPRGSLLRLGGCRRCGCGTAGEDGRCGRFSSGVGRGSAPAWSVSCPGPAG